MNYLSWDLTKITIQWFWIELIMFEIEVILSDTNQITNTYQRITRDPTRKLINDLRSILIWWNNRGYIDNILYKLLYSWLLMIILLELMAYLKFKPGTLLRVIVSFINNQLYYFSLFLHNIMVVFWRYLVRWKIISIWSIN